MSEPKAKYKVNGWGGKRPNQTGRKRKLDGGQYMKFYADEETIAVVKGLVKSGQADNHSEAIRKAIKEYPLR